MRENNSGFHGPANSGGNPVPDLFLERYLLGELPEAETSVLENRLATDPALLARLNMLRKADEDYARTHDAGVLAHGVRERMRRETFEANLRRTASTSARADSRRLPGFAGWKPLLSGAFLLALVAVPAWRVLNGETSTIVHPEVPQEIVATEPGVPESAPKPSFGKYPKAEPNTTTRHTTVSPDGEFQAADADTPPDRVAAADDDDTRLKGYEPGLALFRRTEKGAEPLKPGAVVKPGDIVRIGYRTGGLSFGAIFSVDGSGNVTRHWPTSGDVAVRLGKGETLLPGAFELDAAPDYERFYLLTSEKPFDLKPVLAALHAEKSPARHNVTVVRFDLLKENGI